MKLYEHQEAIVEKTIAIAEQHGFAYINAEARTGKTLSVLTVIKRMGLDSCLFVTKKNAVSSVKADFQDFGFDFNIDIINYESVHKVKNKHQCIVFDEAHKLSSTGRKNSTVKKMEKLIKSNNFKYRFAMSATPDLESAGQLYHQFMLLGYKYPHSMRTHNISHQKYGIPQTTYAAGGMQIETYKIWKPEFRMIFENYMVTMDRYDAEFDIPESTIYKVYCEMDDKLRDTYYSVATSAVHKDLFIDSDIKRFAKLKQLAGGTYIDDNENKVIVGHQNKIDAIHQIMEDKDKIAIYYYFKAEAEYIKGKIQDITTDYDKFISTDTRVYLCQQVSGAEGVDLSMCQAHIMYSFSYSGTTWTQSTERLLNKRRSDEAKVYVLVTKGTIEDKAYDTVMNKRSYGIANYRKKEI